MRFHRPTLTTLLMAALLMTSWGVALSQNVDNPDPRCPTIGDEYQPPLPEDNSTTESLAGKLLFVIDLSATMLVGWVLRREMLL